MHECIIMMKMIDYGGYDKLVYIRISLRLVFSLKKKIFKKMTDKSIEEWKTQLVGKKFVLDNVSVASEEQDKVNI